MNQINGIKHGGLEKVGHIGLSKNHNELKNLNFNNMEVITIESNAFKQLMSLLMDFQNKMNQKSEHSTSEWLTGEEVSKILNVTSRTLQTYRDSGRISFTQTGRKKIYYKKNDVEEFLNNNYIKQYKNGK